MILFSNVRSAAVAYKLPLAFVLDDTLMPWLIGSVTGR